MGTLVQFLVAGVRGAENGTAEFLLRGTSSSAESVLYNDFEGTTQPGTNRIDLDSNGGAEIYCDAYVDVVVRTPLGATIRTVTLGNSAPLVEVQSTSFYGTDYEGNFGLGEPITLKALLDKWIASAGAPDWQVLIGGVVTNLDDAFAAIAGQLFTNVKHPDFGAVGDGVTDDTTAIAAAIASANGGIVFFPPGTYRAVTINLTQDNVNLMGSGVGVSIISGSASGSLISISNTATTGWKNFSDLSFTTSGTYVRLFQVLEGQNVTLSRCVLDGTFVTNGCITGDAAGGLSRVIITDCTFTVGANSGRAIRNAAAAGQREFSVKGCSFSAPAGYTGTFIVGADFSVNGCTFDASAVISGTYYHIHPEDQITDGKFVGTFTGNRFIGGGGDDGYAFRLPLILTGSVFIESGNTFDGFPLPTQSGESGNIYALSYHNDHEESTLSLGSRAGKTLYLTKSDNADDPYLIDAALVAENIVIYNEYGGGASTFEISPTALPPGSRANVLLINTSGSDNLTYVCNSTPGLSTSSTSNIDDGSALPVTFMGALVAVGEERVLCSFTAEFPIQVS